MTEPGVGGGRPPAGWYVDQQGNYRWWDGTRWTEHVAPGPGLAAPAPGGFAAPAGSSWPTSAGSPAVADPFASADPFAAAGPGEPSSRRSAATVVGIVAGAAALLLVGVGAVVLLVRSGGGSSTASTSTSPAASAASSSSPSAASSSPSGSSPSASPVPAVTSSTQGVEVYGDDFASSGSGWTTEKLPSGTTFAYGKDGYVVVAKGELHHYAYAPYEKEIRAISISTTVRTDKAHPGKSGAGVGCDATNGTDGLYYEFFVVPGEGWAIEQGTGLIGGKTKSVLVKTGPTKVRPGDTMTVTGACTPQADGRTTVLTMFVDGERVASVTSTTPMPARTTGWLADLVVTSYGSTASTVVVRDFVVRDTAA